PPQLFMHDISTPDRRLFAIDPDPSIRLQRVYNRLQQLPGVASVAGISNPPVNSLIVPSARVLAEGQSRPVQTFYFLIPPNFFSTLRARLLRGREFDDQDTALAPWTVIVNETAARRLWAGKDPIGQRITFAGLPDEQAREVIGLVPDIPIRSRQTGAEPVIYISYLRHPSRAGQPANLLGL